MACSFTINFQGPATGLVDLIAQKVQGQGGVFRGNDSAGNFDLSVLANRVTGSYTIDGQEISIVVTDKPFFVSCDQIKKFLQNNLVA